MATYRIVRVCAAGLLAIGGVLSGGQCVDAVTIDFEPPTYAPGPLVGQDGWVKNTYYGSMNGSVQVSATSPLAGSQSLSYTQTVAGGLADVSKDNVLQVQAGVAGVDFTISYTISALPNSFGAPNAGVFLGSSAASGSSPIFVRINGGTIEVGASGAFVPINDFFFLAGERIRMTYEVDLDQGSANYIFENLDFGDTYSASYPFFAPYGPATGPNGEYDIDVAALLRGGDVKIDDITLTQGVGPIVSELVWGATGSGNWNQASNWAPTGVPGALPGRQKAILGNAITAPATLYNNETRTLNALEIDSANSYTLVGAGALGFQADDSGPSPVAPVLSVVSGGHTIQLPVLLQDDTTFSVASGATLDLNNVIDLNEHTLTTEGVVRIHNSTIGGGAVVNAGALQASGLSTLGGDLVSPGALVVGWDASGAGGFEVGGDAVLSGVVDVDWGVDSLPQGTIALLTAAGSLDTTGLRLSPEDAGSFTMTTVGNQLMLTFVGVAIPEPSTAALGALVGVSLLLPRRSRRRRLSAASMSAASSGVAAAVIAVLSIGATSGSAEATEINFEPPAYTVGALQGQNGWYTPAYVTTDPFFGGVANGSVEVSTLTPLSGSQSLRYTQTQVPAGAGATGASDVAKRFTVFGKKDGTAAVDITASALLNANSNATGNGQIGFFLGEGAFSPVFVLLSNANSSAGTGDILIGHDFVAPSFGSYAAGSTYEFSVGVDLDSQSYEVSARNVTAGTPAQQLVGPGAGGRFPFFGGAFPADGDSVTYTFDSGVMLRGGVGQLDNFVTNGAAFTQAVWNGWSGDWSENAGWIPNLVPNISAPSVAAPIAIFDGRFNSPQTVYLNGTQSVNGLRFDSVNKYAISGQGDIALRANTVGGVQNPTIEVLAGSHDLQAKVTLVDNTTVTVSPNASLEFNNNLALGGKTLSLSGHVNLNYGVTGGGTITSTGVLGTASNTAIAANLNSTGTLQIDLGAANLDRFSITGNAVLSGLLDVTLEPGYVPAGTYTILSTTGTLDTTGLLLDDSDRSQFTLSKSGNLLQLIVGASPLLGDFNQDGAVDAADYTVWRDNLGAPTDAPLGNRGDNIPGVTQGDYAIWKGHYGAAASSLTRGVSVPEPTAWLMTVFGAALAGRQRRRRGSDTHAVCGVAAPSCTRGAHRCSSHVGAGALAVVAMAGCQRGVELIPVEGVVTINGAPASEGAVTFYDTKTSAQKYVGSIASDGRYTIRRRDEFGAAPGQYRVAVVVTQTAKAPDGTYTGLPTAVSNPKFADPNKSGLEVQVDKAAAPGSFDFSVTK